MPETNLSKNWTNGRVYGILRALSNTLTDDTLGDDILSDIVYSAISSVAEMLGSVAHNDYGEVYGVPLTDGIPSLISLSSIQFDNILKITDSTNGLWKEVSLKDLENFHTNVPQYSKKVIYARLGNNILINAGGNTVNIGSSANIYYTRTPNKSGASLDDTIDIKDKYVDLVIDKAKIKVYEMLRVVAPETLTNSVSNSVERIQQANLAEMKAIQIGKQSKI